MHKTFYASGFIFCLPTQQILLQQKKSTTSVTPQWVLFEKQYSEKKNPEEIFKNTLSKLLNTKIDNVVKIYSYQKDHNKNYSLFYALVDNASDFAPANGHTFKWFSFKEVLKIKADEQTKHDIVIGQRVIAALGRDNDANLQKRIIDASSE